MLITIAFQFEGVVNILSVENVESVTVNVVKFDRQDRWEIFRNSCIINTSNHFQSRTKLINKL